MKTYEQLLGENRNLKKRLKSIQATALHGFQRAKKIERLGGLTGHLKEVALEAGLAIGSARKKKGPLTK